MKTSCVKLADVTFEIKFHFEDNYRRFFCYKTNEVPQCSIEISKERYIQEKELLQHSYPFRLFSNPDIEFNALYRDLSVLLFQRGILTFHGVLIEMNNEGYLFTAESGIGKTTHARLWVDTFPDNAIIINGDKPLLRISDDGLFGYGSPWMGKEKLGRNKFIKIKSICFIERNQTNIIQNVGISSETIEMLIRQTMIKNREKQILLLYRWYKKAINYVTIYKLECNMEKEAALVAFNGMNRKS